MRPRKRPRIAFAAWLGIFALAIQALIPALLAAEIEIAGQEHGASVFTLCAFGHHRAHRQPGFHRAAAGRIAAAAGERHRLAGTHRRPGSARPPRHHRLSLPRAAHRLIIGTIVAGPDRLRAARVLVHC
jgi:hypothetical protein